MIDQFWYFLNSGAIGRSLLASGLGILVGFCVGLLGWRLIDVGNRLIGSLLVALACLICVSAFVTLITGNFRWF